MVTELIEDGVPQRDIYKMIINPDTGSHISDKTFSSAFEDEIRDAHKIAIEKMEQNLFQKAMGDGKSAVTATIFWLKCRAGWKETNITQLQTADGQPFPMTHGHTFQSDEALAEAIKKVLTSVG